MKDKNLSYESLGSLFKELGLEKSPQLEAKVNKWLNAKEPEAKPKIKFPSTLLVMDLEATCTNPREPDFKMEIIEIGIVAVDGTTFAEKSSFQSFVKPTFNTKLSEFCTGLTTITQEQVDAAETFDIVNEKLIDWIGPRNLGSIAYKPTFGMGSWGKYDFNQYAKDCAFHDVINPFENVPHFNLKNMFAENGTRQRREMGLAKALTLCKLEMEGTYHRAINDARNTARLLEWCVGRKMV